VTPTGDIVELGGKRVKDVTGYNLVKLMVGSEGTLGVITKVILRLMPLPKAVVDLLVLFPDPESAIAVVPKIMAEGGCIPTAIEFMDQLSVRTACEYLNEELPYEQAGAMLLIEVDGSDEDTVLRDYETIGELCLANQAQEVYVADNATTRERLWRVRRNIPEAFMTPYKSTEDVVVPPAYIPRLIPELLRISEEFGVQIPCFGHAGDGNVHPKVVKLPEDSPADWDEKLPKVLTELYKVTKALGGTMSGEHGVGAKRKQYLKLFASEAEMEMMRAVKRALDPNNILNPGKIIDV
jgi:glycolate oxidase